MKRSLREDVTADHDPSMMHFDAESLEDISINEYEDDEDHLFSNVNASSRLVQHVFYQRTSSHDGSLFYRHLA